MIQFEKLIRGIASGWQRGALVARSAIVSASILLLVFIGISISTSLNLIDKNFEKVSPIIFSIVFLLIYSVATYERLLEDRIFRKKIESYERQVREDPRKTQLAWELAQAKLESYLNRNLGQVRSIFWLTLVVMCVGFGFVLWGVVRALDTPERLPVAVLASVSGVVISFVGGSFLIIYKSTLGQSADNIAVLERINAVGMAVQILETIPEETASELRNQTTAEIARQLLLMYSSGTYKKPPAKTKAKAG